MGQQLVQIACASRHGVVQHDVVAARPTVFSRLVLQHHAQVVHLAAKSALEPQLHGRHEGLDHALVHAVLGIRHQNPQRLRLELSVQVQALQQVGRTVIPVFGAIEAMALPARVAAAPWGLLYLATVLAQLESGSRGFLVRHLECLTRLGELTKVHVTECHPRDEFKTERQSTRANLPCLADVRGRKIRHQLAHVVLGLAVISTVVDAHIRVVAVGNGLLEAQQRAALCRIRPHSIAARRARHIGVCLYRQVLHVMA